MHERYAVVFREQSKTPAAGSLELRDDRLLLAGRTGHRRLEMSVPLEDIAEIRIGRLPEDRLNGYATIVLERAGLPALQVAPFGAGLLSEIADLLSMLTSERRTGDELAVVVPLKPGCLPRARKLLEAGPPLDPAKLGLSSHNVYLSEDEAVFVFCGPNVSARVGKAMRSPALWRAGLAWQSCIAGQPSVRRSTAMPSRDDAPAYSWTAPTLDR